MPPILSTALFAAAALLTALAAAPAAGSPPAPGRYDRGLLWRVEAPGVAPSYLFGTLHIDDDRVVALRPAVERSLLNARVVAMEALDDERSARRYRAAMMSREPALPGLVGDDAYRRLDDLLRERHIPRHLAPRLKPWAAMLVLVQPRGTTALTLDNLIALGARERNQPVVALETVEEQIEALDGLPFDTQLALLAHAQARHGEIQAAVFPTITAWLARDLRGMFRINAGTMGGDPAVVPHNERFLERVLYQRSERFAERLDPLLREGGAFAAMGALHLYGERGVPALLERSGFKVRRVE